MKKCPKCKDVLPITSFNKNPTRKDGLSFYCKKCQCQYTKDHYRKNKKPYLDRAKKTNKITRQELRELIDSLKSGPCMDCGGSFNPWQMDFDHLGDKKYRVAAMLTTSKSAVLREVAKCELVCANCHRNRTQARSKVVWGCGLFR